MQTSFDFFTVPWSTVALVLAIALSAYLYVMWRWRAGPLPRQLRRGGMYSRRGTGARASTVTIVTVGLVSLSIFAFVSIRESVRQVAEASPDLTVIAHRWWWEVRYEKLGIVTANEMHLPLGMPLVLDLESVSDNHVFWLPQLGRKIELVPGEVQRVWLEVAEPGALVGTCAIACKKGHAVMDLRVVAEEEQKFDLWTRQQLEAPAMPTSDEAVQGAQLFQQLTCINCHTVGGSAALSGKAPDLTHFGSRQTLGAGILSNTRTNLFEWLHGTHWKKAEKSMPEMQLTERDVAALAAYMAILK